MQNKGRNVLITGAAGGIGSAIVHAFLGAGYEVVCLDNVKKPDKMSSINYVCADLDRYFFDTHYASSINDELNIALSNKLDVLINNAAIQIVAPSQELSRSDWQRILNINLLSPFFLIQSFLSKLEKSKGSVINISSIHAYLTKKNFVAYSTTKAALSALTRSMAVDLEHRVRINAIEPAAIETDMLSRGFADFPDKYEKLKLFHPTNRIGTPDEVARVALWLASNDCQFVHGLCLRLDGGISNRLHDPC